MKYELLCELAHGGMAEVFLARARGAGGFEKLLVVKRMRPELARDRAFVDMFLDEARIAATLDHQNVVKVYDAGVEEGVVFMAMEFLHGQDVRSILKRATSLGEKIPLDQALGIVSGVCQGLHYAHEKLRPDGQPLELVHRDVSPHNVFVTYDGAVKVIDFGIAKATIRLTRTIQGVLKGKSGYMSPEQCLGQALDRRSDVFCIGIVLYELVTGRRPFDPSDLRAPARVEPVPPQALEPRLPGELVRILGKAMAKRREARYPTAGALNADLDALIVDLKLNVSQHDLERLIARLYDDEISAWRRSQEQGLSLAEHIRLSAPAPAVPGELTASRTMPEGAEEPPPPAAPAKPTFSSLVTKVRGRLTARRALALFGVAVAVGTLAGLAAAYWIK